MSGSGPNPTLDPPPTRWPGRVAAALLTIWSLATMARGLMWFDTGELALVAVEFGLGHPPGQPLYTLLAGLAARIPGLDPLVGINALSAICAGLCAVPADRIAARAAPDLTPVTRCLTLLAIGVLVPLWDQASRIEVYAPATLVALCLLAGGARAADELRDDGRTWFELGVLAGLGACINPVLALAAALGAGLCSPRLWIGAGVVSTVRAVFAAAIGAVVGLLPYAYIAAVAHEPDRLVWGEWNTTDDVIGYLTGRDYAHTDHQAWSMVPENLGTWLVWLFEHGALAAVIGGLVGWLLTGWLRRRAALWAIPAVVGGGFAFGLGVFFPDVPDYQSYLAPALWLLPAGIAGLLVRAEPRAGFVGAVLLLTIGALVGDRPLTARNRAPVDLPHMLAEAWLAEVPHDGILVVESDHLVFPLLYLQRIENRRPDVVIVNAGWAASRWYWDFLYRTHPRLARIELAAPSTGARLRRLLLSERNRPLRVESIQLAAAMGIRPCPATWGFALGPSCATVSDDPALFEAGIAAGWQGPSGRDPISRRVLAWSAQIRAEGLWALGDTVGALRALRAGAPGGAELPVPGTLTAPPGLQLRPSGTLIGDPAVNLLLGAGVLEITGHPSSAVAWRAAAEAL